MLGIRFFFLSLNTKGLLPFRRLNIYAAYLMGSHSHLNIAIELAKREHTRYTLLRHGMNNLNKSTCSVFVPLYEITYVSDCLRHCRYVKNFRCSSLDYSHTTAFSWVYT